MSDNRHLKFLDSKELKYAQRIAYSNLETLVFTNAVAWQYSDKKGCYVECGTAAGAQVIAMRYGAPNKLIHVFDSFQGIPQPSNKDDQIPGLRMLSKIEQSELPNPGEQEMKTTGITAVDVESFKKHLVDSGAGLENVIIHEGWFEETLPDNDVGDISILRLDGDLYNSTFVCLKHLFPKVLAGGCIIIDDWELSGSRMACIDYFHSIKYNPKYQFISNIAYFYK